VRQRLEQAHFLMYIAKREIAAMQKAQQPKASRPQLYTWCVISSGSVLAATITTMQTLSLDVNKNGSCYTSACKCTYLMLSPHPFLSLALSVSR
jgi:hypothetical protein